MKTLSLIWETLCQIAIIIWILIYGFIIVSKEIVSNPKSVLRYLRYTVGYPIWIIFIAIIGLNLGIGVAKLIFYILGKLGLTDEVFYLLDKLMIF